MVLHRRNRQAAGLVAAVLGLRKYSAGSAFALARRVSARRLPVVGFDLDNTLWDTVATLKGAHTAMVAAEPELLEAYSSPSTWREEVLTTLAAHPGAAHNFTMMRKLTLQRVLGCEARVESTYNAWFEARNTPHFFEGAVEAIHMLRQQGFRLCAISDGNSRPLEIPALTGAFEFAVSSEEAGARKPDPRPFLLAAERAGVPCSDMVYVGDDYEKDIVGAQALGIRAVWVRVPKPVDPEFKLEACALPEEGASAADAEIERLEDLPEALLSLV